MRKFMDNLWGQPGRKMKFWAKIMWIVSSIFGIILGIVLAILMMSELGDMLDGMISGFVSGVSVSAFAFIPVLLGFLNIIPKYFFWFFVLYAKGETLDMRTKSKEALEEIARRLPAPVEDVVE